MTQSTSFIATNTKKNTDSSSKTTPHVLGRILITLLPVNKLITLYVTSCSQTHKKLITRQFNFYA